MEGDDFVQFGVAPTDSRWGPKVIGKTKEERQQIAKEIRQAAKKAKKKEKSDAKKQRKQNAIMHRRMTRNNEKYSKNKERNKQRAMDLERQRIRNEAIRQAEYLAAEYDPSGKLFNVGEVVRLEDGTVKSKEALRRAEEARARREAEKLEREAERRAKEEAKKAIKGGKVPPSTASASVPVVEVEGVNPARAALIQNLGDVASSGPQKKMSNKQKQRQELYAPKPIPPKPVIPEGYSIPEGEEDFLALWDISDEGIHKRMIKEAQRKGNARRELRRAQKAQQKINKQLKIRRKQAANLGIIFDKEAALKEIMRLQKKKDDDGENSDEDSEDSDGSLEFDSDGGVIEDEVPEKKERVWEKRPKLAKVSEKELVPEVNELEPEPVPEPKPVVEVKPISEKKSKRSAPEDVEDEPISKKSKKSKKSTSEVEPEPEPELEPIVEGNPKKSKKSKKSMLEAQPKSAPILEEKAVDDEPKSKVSKKSKKSSSEVQPESAPIPEEQPIEPQDDESARKGAKRLRKEAKKAAKEQGKLAANGVEVENGIPAEMEIEEKSSKKRKRDRAEDVVGEDGGVEKEKKKKSKKEKKEKVDEVEVEEVEEPKKKKSKKEKKEKRGEEVASVAEQWNPEALTGDEARKAKYLRLLGAGKVTVNASASKEMGKGSGKGKKEKADIKKVESELERQFEAGIKLKHDGGGKRRGLGA